MVELEVQVLALEREGLLMDMGRILAAHGFALQRQRLVQDPHGALLTLVVRGSPRRQRDLDKAIAAHERVVSSLVEEAADGGMRPHFAATRAVAASGYVPPPVEVMVTAAPAPAAAQGARPVPAAPSAVPLPASAADGAAIPELVMPLAAAPEPGAGSASPSPALPEPLCLSEPELLLPAPPPPPAPPPVPLDPYVEIVPLPPDTAAVAALLAEVDSLYPQRLIAALRTLDGAVAPGAREPTLLLAGQRIGAWLSTRQGQDLQAASLAQAIAVAGLPVLRELVAAEAQGTQLHVQHSPLCTEPGHSGCAFFSGLLEGLLGPAAPSGAVGLFNVCCRAWGADACVLAVSD